jgi:hypothetical protein
MGVFIYCSSIDEYIIADLIYEKFKFDYPLYLT